jgi:hypothetical protein
VALNPSLTRAPTRSAHLTPVRREAVGLDRAAPVGLIDQLVDEHRALERRFDAAVGASALPAAECRRLVAGVVQHEVAEEVVVYPAARQLGVANRELLDARLDEQHRLEDLLEQLEQLGVTGDGFGELLAQIGQLVNLHATYEERTVLEPLRAVLAPAQLAAMGAQFERTKLAVPLHPYPVLGVARRRHARADRSALLLTLRRIRDRSNDAWMLAA